jgi:uncharacterized membrane protein
MKDNMGPDWYRMNTVFKLYLPAWLLVGTGTICSTGACINRFIDSKYTERNKFCTKKSVAVAQGVVLLTILAVICSTPLISYKTLGGGNSHRPTLDGYAWMEQNQPNDYAAVLYLRDRAPDSLLVEAEGGDYQYYGRISSATGIPAILGWPFHESMWRGDNPPGWYGERMRDLHLIYEQPDQAVEIMQKYNANLLIVGDSERERYAVPLDAAAFASLPELKEVFVSGETAIYEIL